MLLLLGLTVYLGVSVVTTAAAGGVSVVTTAAAGADRVANTPTGAGSVYRDKYIFQL